jgi:NitT/TauT family transport system substrate-binding protein
MSNRALGRLLPSRRRFLKTSMSVASTLALPLISKQSHAAASLKPVTITLDWLYQGPNAGFLVAQEKGFYRDAGLDATITAGKGSASTAQLVASKAAQIGFADGFVVGNSVAKGMGIRGVGAIFRRNPSAIMLFADSPIKTPKDIEGKTIAISAGSAVTQQWPAFCKGYGVDVTKVQVVNIDPAGIGPALITGKFDAIGGYVSSYVPTLEIRGKREVRIFWFADAGVGVVSNSIIAQQDLLKNDPDLVRALVPATIKGFIYGRNHPDEAIAAVQKYLETADVAITRRELEVSWKLWVTPNTKGKPLGWNSDADWTTTIGVLKDYGGLTVPLQAGDLYTNEYVPSGAEFIPPQDS